MDSISKEHLAQLLQAPVRPIIIDARRDDAYAAASGVIPGAVHRDANAATSWASEIELARPIVVYCIDGGELVRVLPNSCARGPPRSYLEGGFRAWEASGRSIAQKPGAPSQWVTRERPKIDRIACPWLIRRFIDADARFLYVPAVDVLKVAEETGAIPYDIPGVTLTHRGERCSFDAFIEDYRLTDPALARIADIVRGRRYRPHGPCPAGGRIVCDFAGALGQHSGRSRHAAAWPRDLRRTLCLDGRARAKPIIGLRERRHDALHRIISEIAALAALSGVCAKASRRLRRLEIKACCAARCHR